MLFLITVAFSTALLATDKFEGKLILSGKTTGDKTLEYTYPLFIQGDKLLYKADEKLQIIVDSRTGEMNLLTQNQGNTTAIRLNLKYLESAGGLQTFMGSSAPFDMQTIDRMDNEGTLKKTGESKTISGQKCQKYLLNDEEWEGEIWVSENPPYDFSGLYGVLDIETMQGFPLSGVLKNKKNGKTQEFNMLFEKQTLDPSLFEVGKNVQIVDLSMMLQNQDPKQIEQMIKQMLPPEAR